MLPVYTKYIHGHLPNDAKRFLSIYAIYWRLHRKLKHSHIEVTPTEN